MGEPPRAVVVHTHAHAIPRRPVGAAAAVVSVAVPPSTRPPSFATYPPSVYPPPSSVRSYQHRDPHGQRQFEGSGLEPPQELDSYHSPTGPPPPPRPMIGTSHLTSSSSSGLPIDLSLHHHQLDQPPLELQRIIPYSPAWHKTKIIIRSLVTLFEFAVVTLCVITAIRFSPQYHDDRGIQGWHAVLPVVLFCITYDIVELFTFCLRWRLRRGMHPAATVTADLVCVLVCALGLTFNIHNATITNGGYYGVMVLCAEGLLGLICIGHFVLFVRACVETKQRNRSKDASELAYVYSPAGGKPFPILHKDVYQVDRGSETGWTAVTGGTTVHNLDLRQQQQQQQQQQQPPVMNGTFPPRVGLGHGRAPTYTSSIHPPRAPPSEAESASAPPSVYWRSMAGSGNGFEGYRGPSGADAPVPEEGSVSRSDHHLRTGSTTEKKEMRNQKEIIPPEVMAEYYDRIVTPAEGHGYGHDRIGGSSSGYYGDSKGEVRN
ncbi:hypothetical protein QBC44DRAFT_9357 [Cladorrhinum sp. PSN332]|nr:hypothetical protein QBC44DRAFT_9357 [Cladorrhinum sp. PSN332]